MYSIIILFITNNEGINIQYSINIKFTVLIKGCLCLLCLHNKHKKKIIYIVKINIIIIINGDLEKLNSIINSCILYGITKAKKKIMCKTVNKSCENKDFIFKIDEFNFFTIFL